MKTIFPILFLFLLASCKQETPQSSFSLAEIKAPISIKKEYQNAITLTIPFRQDSSYQLTIINYKTRQSNSRTTIQLFHHNNIIDEQSYSVI